MVGGFFLRWPDSFPSTTPICLYADAVANACQNRSLPSGILACHVAAERRGIDYRQHTGLQWCGLPSMLERFAAAQPSSEQSVDIQPRELIVQITKLPSALELAESLDLLLAALALDWHARLIVAPLALQAFRLDRPDDLVKPYASLSLYGLNALETEYSALAAAPPLVLPIKVQSSTADALLRFDLTRGEVGSKA
jgi:hypothetical protein